MVRYRNLFEEAWKNREVVELDDLKILFISRSDLIRAKEGRKTRLISISSRKPNNWRIGGDKNTGDSEKCIGNYFEKKEIRWKEERI